MKVSNLETMLNWMYWLLQLSLAHLIKWVGVIKEKIFFSLVKFILSVLLLSHRMLLLFPLKM